MHTLSKTLIAIAVIAFSSPALAQSETNDAEELKIAALEALISAPPDRALPLAAKALQGDHSDEVKSRALFVLSQIDQPEAQNLLLDTARQASGETRLEAIRMIGIGGDATALSSLGSLYADGDEDIRDAVLEAYLIADDKTAVYQLAANAETEDEFEAAVEMLGVMDAREELRQLRDTAGVSESLIEAYTISGDAETLRELAMDGSDAERQAQAIEALGIVGGSEVDATLVEIYRGAQTDEIREAALDGMLISGYDAGVLELYRASQDPAEKKELLEYLVIMGSDDVWDVIDSALDGGP